jgi:Family of unknown function (DUF5681)
MSEENMSDGYEVGYGKPPRTTQFQKGVSGNPKGRPKKALDFDHELLRQSKASVTLNENGNRRRVSKHEAAILQLLNKAISGNIPALRTYFDRYQIASEKVAQLEAAQAKEAERRSDFNNWTDEELWKLITDGQKDNEQETKKGHISNKD